MSTPIPHVPAARDAKPNSAKIPSPVAFSAASEEETAGRSALCRKSSETNKPTTKPSRSPINGITKNPTIPTANPIRTDRPGMARAFMVLPVRTALETMPKARNSAPMLNIIQPKGEPTTKAHASKLAPTRRLPGKMGTMTPAAPIAITKPHTTVQTICASIMQ